MGTKISDYLNENQYLVVALISFALCAILMPIIYHIDKSSIDKFETSCKAKCPVEFWMKPVHNGYDCYCLINGEWKIQRL